MIESKSSTNTATTKTKTSTNNLGIYDDSVDVAIIGMGVRLPGNGNCRPSQLWESLLNGFDGIIDTTERWSDSYSKMSEVSSNKAGLLELEDWMTFDPLFFGINPTDAKQVDPQQKMLLKTTWEAFEDAGIDPLTMRGSDTTVFIGTSLTDYLILNADPHEPPINYVAIL
eukprot:gene9656-11838_t